MLDKLLDLSYGQARYNFLKELDTGGPIGELFLMMHPVFGTEIMRLSEFNDTWLDWQGDYPPEQPDLLLLRPEMYNTLMQMNERLTNAILLNSQLDWNTFFSSYMVFVATSIEVTHKLMEHYNKPETQHEFIENHDRLDILAKSFDPILKLIQLGQGYEELLSASHSVAEELKSWQQSNPASVRLSRAYLEAIGFNSNEDR